MFEKTPIAHVSFTAAQMVEKTDEVLIQAIIESAKEAGVTDLYLLDKKFILEAIQEKMNRTYKRSKRDLMKRNAELNAIRRQRLNLDKEELQEHYCPVHNEN